MILPESTSSASRWYVHDYAQTVVFSEPASAGVMVARLGPVPQDELWLIDRAVVVTTSSADTVAFLYLDAVDDSRVVDGTRAGNFDVADQSSAIHVPGGSEVLCQWRGADAGAVGTLRVQYTVMRQEVA